MGDTLSQGFANTKIGPYIMTIVIFVFGRAEEDLRHVPSLRRVYA